jgi:hypothetical protein
MRCSFVKKISDMGMSLGLIDEINQHQKKGEQTILEPVFLEPP